MLLRESPSGAAPDKRYLVGAVLIAITSLAGALRFTRLGAQSFWEDEVVTSDLLRAPLRTLVRHEIPSSESTPPLYYVAAWVWVRVVGAGETGLRSLSAVVGTATVPVVYFAARSLTTLRAALLAALFVALSPILVWFSQEGRAYALFVFLSALSVLFFARTLARYSALDLAGWSVSSALALTAHYFAGLLVAIEAVWLIQGVRRPRALALAVAPVAVVGIALLPLLLKQRSEGHAADLVKGTSVLRRLGQLGAWFATGDLRAIAVLATVGVVTTLGLWLLFRRTDDSERWGGLIALGLGMAVIAVPVALAAAGADYVFYRNLIPAWLLLAVALAAGFTGRRAGIVGVGAAAVLCAAFLAADVAVFTRPSLQRDDWRSVASTVSGSGGPTAVVVYPAWDARPVLHYAPSVATTSARAVRVREVWFVGVSSRYSAWTSPRKLSIGTPPGFRQVSSQRFQHFLLRRFLAPRPTLVDVSQLERLPGAAGSQQVPRARVLVHR